MVLTSGTSYYAKVIDANTFSLASSFTNATESPETLLSFGGGNGHAADTFSTVYAQAYLNDNFVTPATSIGISAEINQVVTQMLRYQLLKKQIKIMSQLIPMILVTVVPQKTLVSKQIKHDLMF